jgi:hypothetical protein
MFKKLSIAIALALVLWFPQLAKAENCNAQACVYTATWTEPATNTDGSALTNLASTSLYYQVNGGVAQ